MSGENYHGNVQLFTSCLKYPGLFLALVGLGYSGALQFMGCSLILYGW